MSGKSLAAAALAIYAAAPTAVSATKLAMFNNSQVVPGTVSLLQYDTETNSFSRVAEASGIQQAEASVVDAAVVCGSKFYAVWTQVPVADGVLQVDMNSRKMDYLPAGDSGNQGTIYHALACGSSEDTLLALATRPASSGGVSFHLMRYNTTDPSSSTEIGAFPDSLPFVGYDTMYRFSADNKYLYASFANNEFVGKATSGSTFVMSTTDGSIAAHWEFPDNIGMPYTMLPTNTLGETFKGAFVDGKTFEVKLCDVSPSADSLTAVSGSGGGGGSASVGNCKSADAMWSASAPMPVCKSDGKLWTFPLSPAPGAPQQLTSVDVKTGELKPDVDLSTVVPFAHLGTIAC